MLKFTNYTVRTDNPQMIVRNKVTGTVGRAQTRQASDSETDYEEIPRSEYEAEKRAEAVREVYVREVKRRISERYTPDEESAIQRKALALLFSPQTVTDNGADASEAEKAMAEFNEYNVYAEEVKAKVKAQAEEIYEEEQIRIEREATSREE